jgi:LmbE family N-acetylglucosaminyl deacetylase/RimJ/RimL family protein N-acetyltransferase
LFHATRIASAGSLGTMSRVRSTVRRLLGVLPDRQADQVRRAARGVQQRLPGLGGEPVTYVVSPHPDDETLRLAGFVTWLHEQRPDHRLVLVAIGDGGASARARRMGWSSEQERDFRRTEQTTAWSALTGGTGEVIRRGLPDGAYTAEGVLDALRPLATKRARFFVAAHEDDYHPDHLAVVAGVRLLKPPHARFSLSPLMTGKGTEYAPPATAMRAAETAARAYEGFGHRSVPQEFRALVKDGYRSRVTSFAPAAKPPGQRQAAKPVSSSKAASEPASPREAAPAKNADLVVYDRLALTFNPNASGPRSDYTLALPTEQTLTALAERYTPAQLSERKLQILRDRVADPDEDCWLVEDADGVAGGFCSVSWVDHFEGASNSWTRVRPHQVLLMDDMVFKDHRRRGLHGYSIWRRCEIGWERGRTQALVLVRTDNVASRRSYQALGFEYAGRLYYSKARGRSVMVPEDAASRLRELAGQ